VIQYKKLVRSLGAVYISGGATRSQETERERTVPTTAAAYSTSTATARVDSLFLDAPEHDQDGLSAIIEQPPSGTATA
jgi:isocitrate lyase